MEVVRVIRGPRELQAHPDVVVRWRSRNGIRVDFDDASPETTHVAGLTVGVCTYKRADSLRRFLSSLETQARVPDDLIIIDASPDDQTERVVVRFAEGGPFRFPVTYMRVQGQLRGLTRQRNVAIELFRTDLACFFDDDIELEPDTLQLLEEPLREREDLIATGCYLGSLWRGGMLPLRWRGRRLFGLWNEKHIGRLAPWGMAVPYSLWAPFGGVREVDIVQGGATCWRTSVLKAVPFDEGFAGYGQAEDIEYSLRTRRFGPKAIVGKACPLHHHTTGGRISQWEYGRQCGLNFTEIYFRFGERSVRSSVLFLIWQSLDLLMLLGSGKVGQALGRVAGLGTYWLKRLRV